MVKILSNLKKKWEIILKSLRITFVSSHSKKITEIFRAIKLHDSKTANHRTVIIKFLNVLRNAWMLLEYARADLSEFRSCIVKLSGRLLSIIQHSPYLTHIFQTFQPNRQLLLFTDTMFHPLRTWTIYGRDIPTISTIARVFLV